MSTAQHLMRIRAAERDEAWGPRYVGNELAGTRQAATQHHQNAALRRAEATNTADPAERARLDRDARQAAALAATLDAQTALLEQAEHAYLRHRVSTAVGRAAADVSRRIVAERHEEPEPRTTAAEWLDAHQTAVTEDERHRPIRSDDVDDINEVARDDVPVDDREQQRGPVVETQVEPDLREVAEHEPRQVGEDRVHVPDAEPVADSLRRARRAIHEVEAREAYERQIEAEHHAEQAGR